MKLHAIIHFRDSPPPLLKVLPTRINIHLLSISFLPLILNPQPITDSYPNIPSWELEGFDGFSDTFNAYSLNTLPG